MKSEIKKEKLQQTRELYNGILLFPSGESGTAPTRPSTVPLRSHAACNVHGLSVSGIFTGVDGKEAEMLIATQLFLN